MNISQLKKIICLFSVFLSFLIFTNGKGFSIDSDFSLISLLGKSVNNADIKNFMLKLNEKPEINNFEMIDGTIYYSFKKSGISFLFKKDKLDTIFLYSEGHEGFKQYKGTIPAGVNFSDNRATANKKLGLPSQSGGGGKVPEILKSTIDKIPIWDKWRFPRYALHIEYYDDGEIAMITLSQNTNE
jgi:hypothetical protein